MASSLSRSSSRLRLRRYLPFPGLGSDRLSVLSRGGDATSRRAGKISNSRKRETFCDSLQLFTPMLKTLTSSHSKLVNFGKVGELSMYTFFFLFPNTALVSRLHSWRCWIFSCHLMPLTVKRVAPTRDLLKNALPTQLPP